MKSLERIKANGEIFTPVALVEEILEKLPLSLFTDSNKTFLDPACGDGVFLVQVLKKKIKNGSSKTKALKTTFGVELMQDNVDECREKMLEICGNSKRNREIVNMNVVCANSLTGWDFEEWKPKQLQEEVINDLVF